MNLYFLKAGEYVKIGIAKDIKGRISSLQQGQHQKIQFCGAMGNLTKDVALQYKRKLHKRFRNSRVSGEWFYLPKFELYDSNTGTFVYGDGGFCIDSLLEINTTR